MVVCRTDICGLNKTIQFEDDWGESGEPRDFPLERTKSVRNSQDVLEMTERCNGESLLRASSLHVARDAARSTTHPEAMEWAVKTYANVRHGSWSSIFFLPLS